MVGLRVVDAYPIGPDHEYVAADTDGVESENEFPSQTGLVLVAVAVGRALTTTLTDDVAVHVPTVTTTVYVPAIAVVAFNRIGFCTVDVKPLGWYYSTFNAIVSTYTATTAVIGDTACFDFSITGLTYTDTDITNNTGEICRTIGGPWDPNAKEVSPVGIGATGDVMPETKFYYTLHFQNTGTAPAINIYVLDTISSNLDMNSFQILATSHAMNPIITNANIIRFDFPTINLPDSNANEPMSHGWVRYSIRAKTGLANGTQIKNTGHIYFDYNPAIVTNTTLNTINPFLTVNTIENVKSNNVFYPNPAKNNSTLLLDKPASGVVHIIDARGVLVKQIHIVNQSSVNINLQNLTAGIYYIKIPGVELKQNKIQVIQE